VTARFCDEETTPVDASQILSEKAQDSTTIDHSMMPELQDLSIVRCCPSKIIEHGMTVSTVADVNSTPTVSYTPNSRIGSSPLTINEAVPIAVVPSDNRLGSQPF